jgi:hypothetical protein
MEEITRQRYPRLWPELGDPLKIANFLNYHLAILEAPVELPSRFRDSPGAPDTFLAMRCQRCRVDRVTKEVLLLGEQFVLTTTGTAVRHTLQAYQADGGGFPVHGMFKQFRSDRNPDRRYLDFVPMP